MLLTASAQAANAGKAKHRATALAQAEDTARVNPASSNQSESTTPCSTTETAPLINVPVGKSAVLKLQAPASRIIMGNPEGGRAARPTLIESGNKYAQREGGGVAKPTLFESGNRYAQSNERNATSSSSGVADVDVVLLNPNEIYLLGKSVGSTNIIVRSRAGVCTIMNIVVGIDTMALESRLNQFLPGSAIKVTAAADSVVLSGSIADATQVERAMLIAAAYAGQGGSSKVINMLSVANPQQVMLEVKVAEINRTLAEKLGFDFAKQLTGGGGAWTKVISGIIGGGAGKYNKNINATQKIGPGTLDVTGPVSSAVTVPFQVPGGTPGFPTIAMPAGATADLHMINGMLTQTSTNLTTQDFTSWLVDAQKTDGLVKILAEPNIVAISGQEGSFLAGGEIMIPVPQTNGTVGLEGKTFGVGLRFTPTVLEEGRINIKVAPEVTDLVGFNPVATSGLGSTVVVPTFTTRRVNTTVQLREGQSLAIGGLLQDNFNEQVKRFPVLGEIPILGALFRSSEYQKNKTELLIVVTPRLIKPLAPDYTLPTDAFVEPSRSEFLFDGRMEGGKSQRGQSDAKTSVDQKPASGGFELK
jgi:pilus assembly protein CpaC